MSGTLAVSRRALLQAGGALVVEFNLLRPVGAWAAPAAKKPPGSLASDNALDSWIRIDPDGTVTVFTGKVELGQGFETALAQVAAEELDVSLHRLRVVMGDTDRTPNEGYTAGSWSMVMSGTALRYAGAEARYLLLKMAAAELRAPYDKLAVEDGIITLPGSNRRTTYWDLVGGRFFRYRVTGAVEPKSPSSYTVVGKPVQRLDIPAKVSGGAAYVQDLRPSGMVHARVLRPPSYGARLLSVDERQVAQMPGVVKVVRNGSYLAVLADKEWQAIQAKQKLAASAKWQETATLPAEADLYQTLVALPTEDQVILDRRTAGAAPGTHRLEATYHRPYTMHAAIGPSCAIGLWENGGLTVWTQTQGVYPLRSSLANMLHVSEERIHCIYAEGSGCYGHNGADDAAADAALLAQALPGRPVRVQWMRGDENAWEPYGPAMVMRVSAAVDDGGRIVDWNYEVWSQTHTARPDGTSLLMPEWYLADAAAPPPTKAIPMPEGGGDRNALPIYDLPSAHVVYHFIPATPLRSSALRSLGAYANIFAIESFMDELAAASNADPVDYRLRHLKDPRGAAVIKAAADRFGWSDFKKSPGRGRGIGFARYKNEAAYAAVAVEVEVDSGSGHVKVPRAVIAGDSGLAVNPDGIRNQFQGAVVQSASWTLMEAVKFNRTRITSLDWHGYPILRFPDVPEVDAVVIDRPDSPYLGTGEVGQAPTVAAIANAIAHATGVRLRELPFTPDRVKAALHEASTAPSQQSHASGSSSGLSGSSAPRQGATAATPRP